MSIHNLRERANLWLAGHKDTVLKTFKWLNVFVSALAILTLIYFYGFSHSAEVESIIFGIIEGSFAFYVVHYIVRLIYDFNPQKFLRRTWTEGFLMFWLVTCAQEAKSGREVQCARVVRRPCGSVPAWFDLLRGSCHSALDGLLMVFRRHVSAHYGGL